MTKLIKKFQGGGQYYYYATPQYLMPVTTQVVRPTTNVQRDREQGKPIGTTTMERAIEAKQKDQTPVVKAASEIPEETQQQINRAQKINRVVEPINKGLDVAEWIPFFGGGVTLGRGINDATSGDYTSLLISGAGAGLGASPLIKKILKKGANELLGVNITRVKPNKAGSNTTLADDVLADVRYRGNRNKKVKVMSPERTESSIDGKTIDPTTLTMEEKPTTNGFIVEQVVPGFPVYAYNGKPVLSNVKNQEWFKYEGKYRPKSDIKTTTIPSSQVEVGQKIPNGSGWIPRYGGDPIDLTGEEIFRTPSGHFRKSFVDIYGNPIRGLRNPGTQRALGLTTIIGGSLLGLNRTGKILKGAGEGILENGVVSGVVNEFKQPNNQQVNNQQQEPEYFSIKDAEKMVEDSWNE